MDELIVKWKKRVTELKYDRMVNNDTLSVYDAIVTAEIYAIEACIIELEDELTKPTEFVETSDNNDY